MSLPTPSTRFLLVSEPRWWHHATCRETHLAVKELDIERFLEYPLVLEILVCSQSEPRVHYLTEHGRSESAQETSYALRTRHLCANRPERIAACSRVVQISPYWITAARMLEVREKRQRPPITRSCAYQYAYSTRSCMQVRTHLSIIPETDGICTQPIVHRSTNDQ